VPAEALLTGGLGLLPLAPLSDESEPQLPGVIRRMEERLNREAPQPERDTLWTATYFLMGLRYPGELATRLLQGVQGMKESATYQLMAAEAMGEEARRFLLLLGEDRFGPPDAPTAAALNAITDVDRLERLGVRLLHVASWQELLATP
jgi:hypothetical protein